MVTSGRQILHPHGLGMREAAVRWNCASSSANMQGEGMVCEGSRWACDVGGGVPGIIPALRVPLHDMAWRRVRGARGH